VSPQEQARSARLVLDWDGTVTERDTLDLLLREFGDQEIYDRVEGELGRTMTLHEVIAAEFATVITPLEEVVPWLLENTRIRPGFAELAGAQRPLIISSGFHETIEPLLEREGVRDAVELRANRLDPRSDGWRVRFRAEHSCATCGEPCKRRDLPEETEIVYAGDGYSDRCVALAADRVFARDGLAEWLASRNVEFEPLTDFYALAAEL
jgi:2-hydroxy-3-keto-5-methylthiopentenyl-1-phosphate phosphatase